MYRGNHPFLLTLLLVAIGLRTVFGAPCCLAWETAAHAHSADQQHHQAHSADCHENHAADAFHSRQAHAHQDQRNHETDHQDHAHSAASNPCCSACGPTLPSDPIVLADRDTVNPPIAAMTIRALRTRPPFPAYDARGPPILT